MTGAGRASLVHVHGGRALLDRLAAAGLPGDRLEWCDPVCSGPTPAGLADDEWYRTRAEHLRACAEAGDAAPIEARLRAQDLELAAVAPGAEIAIWAGPELYCQAILMRLLVLLAARSGSGPITLVEPGDHPRLRGCTLAGREPGELRAAFDARRSATAAAFALARRAWDAFTRPGARPLARLVATDTSALPYLGAALGRHLADLPDGATGLSTTETYALEVLRAGPHDPGALLAAVAAREARPWLTDAMLGETLRRLGGTDAPLVARAESGAFSLTRRGDDVLAGYDTWTAERWLGGIHIGAPGAEDEDDGEPEPAAPRGRN
jgi:hypothetical protein